MVLVALGMQVAFKFFLHFLREFVHVHVCQRCGIVNWSRGKRLDGNVAVVVAIIPVIIIIADLVMLLLMALSLCVAGFICSIEPFFAALTVAPCLSTPSSLSVDQKTFTWLVQVHCFPNMLPDGATLLATAHC